MLSMGLTWRARLFNSRGQRRVAKRSARRWAWSQSAVATMALACRRWGTPRRSRPRDSASRPLTHTWTSKGNQLCEAHVAEPQLGVEPVEVEVQALATAPDQLEATALAVAEDGEAGARLHRGQHADQPGHDAVTGGDGAGQLLFGLPAVLGVVLGQVQIGPPSAGGQALGVGLELGRGGGDVAVEVLEQHALVVQERLEPPRHVEPGQVPFEDQPVEAGKLANHPILVNHLERGHGLVPSVALLVLVDVEVHQPERDGASRPRGLFSPGCTDAGAQGRLCRPGPDLPTTR